MIEIKDLVKTYGTAEGSVEALRGVSLTVAPREIHGIIGHSGAGKSTLVRCVNLLERPSAGSVRVNGVELTALAPRELRAERRKIGMIFQQFNLFASRTVFENVAYPLAGSPKAQKAARVRELLSLVGLEDKENAYPSKLSGGQKQRVAIARALASSPEILLCDEATSALDPQTTFSILRLLKELNARLGLTIVIVTHEMQVVKEVCSRVTVMENGLVAETGDVYSIFASPRERVTQSFVDTATNFSKINALIDEYGEQVFVKPNECLLKLRYVGGSASRPLVSEVSRRFGVDVNIIFGNFELLDCAAGGTLAQLGGLVAVMDGEAAQKDAAIEYLRQNGALVEVVSDAGASERAHS